MGFERRARCRRSRRERGQHGVGHRRPGHVRVALDERVGLQVVELARLERVRRRRRSSSRHRLGRLVRPLRRCRRTGRRRPPGRRCLARDRGRERIGDADGRVVRRVGDQDGPGPCPAGTTGRKVPSCCRRTRGRSRCARTPPAAASWCRATARCRRAEGRRGHDPAAEAVADQMDPDVGAGGPDRAQQRMQPGCRPAPPAPSSGNRWRS